MASYNLWTFLDSPEIWRSVRSLNGLHSVKLERIQIAMHLGKYFRSTSEVGITVPDIHDFDNILLSVNTLLDTYSSLGTVNTLI